MNVRYRVELSQTERTELTELLSGGKHAARRLKRAQILLAADGGASDEAIATNVGVGSSTVYRTKRRFVLGNLEAALSEEPRPGANRKLSGKEEALLVATACSSPPAGRARWTLELLSGELVRLTAHESVSRETVRRRLAENDLKPWRKDMWCIPQVDADYVARMEDVLDLYSEAPDPERPVVCFDESPIQLIGEVRRPIPPEPGQIERYDCEYKRNGTANLFVFLDVNRPWRKVKVTERRAAEDFAVCMRDLTDVHYPEARAHSRGARQLVDPFRRRALPDFPSRRSATGAAPAGVPLRPQARQLAEHGRDRDRRPGQSMSRSAHRKLHPACRRDRRLGEATQRRMRPHQLDVHNPKSPRQNGARLPQAHAQIRPKSKSQNLCDEVLVPPHRDLDRLKFKEDWQVSARPEFRCCARFSAVRRMRPACSSVSTIWCTLGGETWKCPACRFPPAAGGRYGCRGR